MTIFLKIPSKNLFHIPFNRGRDRGSWLNTRASPDPVGGLLAAVVIFSATNSATLGDSETFRDVPQTLSGDDRRPARIHKPKSKRAESCTIKCVTTCIRGGAGSPGEGPLNARRLRFLGKVLSVEKATAFTSNEKQIVEKPLDSQKCASSSLLKTLPVTGDISIPGSCSNSVKAGDPIASRLGIDYPFPPHLEYAYPPPDGNILTNIVNALIAVPRFYTQVLHLMNKMNLPAPFRVALPTPPLPPAKPAPPPPPPPPPAEPHLADLSSDESELESPDEGDADEKKSALTHGRKRKKAKVDPIVGPAVDKGVSHEAAGVRPISLVLKENYAAGEPSPVLYIKNLAKDVTTDDFCYIFGAFFGGVQAAKSRIGVKLMQEGRMRGQAFVTFSSVDLAQQALKALNGFVFKGKPMIIQFGRNTSLARAQ